ncbi:14015_t:CDS:1, partial [Entrophospora sp. SA101]
KTIVVSRLKELGEVIAGTGDGTNDGPALKLADVGFSMGIAGTEVAKEASAIILMDDNFNSIVKALKWGRAVNDSVRKFLQFQLTGDIAAVVLSFTSAVTSDDNESILTAVQLLWVNLIMDTLAALALATEPPTDELLNRRPTSKTASLISYRMWKMIIGQAIFQIIINLFVISMGAAIFHLDEDDKHDKVVLRSIVFNTFVFLQVFNEINCRSIDDNLN